MATWQGIVLGIVLALMPSLAIFAWLVWTAKAAPRDLDR
jgi:hypothetical protein